MTVIKNKRELVLRAEGHARSDHIMQGTYGDISANGSVEFYGCAIGCLATPHRQKELRAFFDEKKVESVPGVSPYVPSGVFHSRNLLTKLEEEFGICPALGRCAEAIFEDMPTHGSAISFIPKFARALPEGVDITGKMLAEIWPDIIKPTPDSRDMGLWNQHMTSSLLGPPPGWVTRSGAESPWCPAEVAEKRFLKWLRSLAQKPVAA